MQASKEYLGQNIWSVLLILRKRNSRRKNYDQTLKVKAQGLAQSVIIAQGNEQQLVCLLKSHVI